MLQRTPTVMRSRVPLYPIAALALAAAIFGIDTFSSLDSAAIAVGYVVVVLMSANFFDRKGLLAADPVRVPDAGQLCDRSRRLL